MADTYDVAVIGLGAMGSAAAYQLSRRGQRVLGLDRFTPPHTLGSSHGQTRIIREAYFEHPSYVPIVQRAYELWAELEKTSGKQIIMETGGLMIGNPNGELVTGAEYSARLHHLAYERLSSEEVHQRHPAFHLTDDMVAIWDPRAGILFPEDCIASYLILAQQSGATLRYDEPVISWQPNGQGIEIKTSQGQYLTEKLLLSAGAWTGSLMNGLDLPLEVERQVLFWYEAMDNTETFNPDSMPIFVVEPSEGFHFYGFPNLGEGIKVARMHHGETVNPDDIDREVSPQDERPVREFLESHIPNAPGKLLASEVCMFTNMPDLNFLIDFHPEHSNVLIASPCSGHGFKFASAIGEILADLMVEGETRFDIGFFGLDRLSDAK